MLRAAIAGLSAALVIAAAEEPKAPVAANPIVNLSGRITRVDAFRPREGMPAIVVDADGITTVVVLGSMRYLMEQNFNPKAGEQVKVKGYKLPDAVLAIEVKLPAENVTLKLRDEGGWPLWRGGRWRGGGCPGCGSRPE
jgi:hypothetical protein